MNLTARQLETVRLRQAGFAYKEIARMRGISPDAIRGLLRHAKARGVDTRFLPGPSGRAGLGRASSIDHEAIVRLRAQGLSLGRIAATLGYHRTTVAKHARMMRTA